MAPKGRPACTLDSEELSEVFTSHGLQHLKPDSFQAVNVCTVHSHFAALFKTLLAITRALTWKTVAAALPAPKLSSEQKRVVAKSLCNAFSDLLLKERNFRRKGIVPRPAAVYEMIFEESQQRGHDSDDEEPRDLLSRSYTISDGEESESPVNLLEMPASSSDAVAPQPLIPAAQQIDSSQEAPAAVDYTSLPHWWDSAEEKFAVQLPGSGKKVYGECAPGPTGNLIVTWPDGTTQQTEVSNLATVVAKEEKKRRLLQQFSRGLQLLLRVRWPLELTAKRCQSRSRSLARDPECSMPLH